MFAAATGLVCLLAVVMPAAGTNLVPARPAAAIRFTVTTTADAHDAHPGDGRCADAAGQCTLRAAVEEAGASPAGSQVTIEVPAGTYLLTLGTLTAGGLAAPVSIAIDGAGQRGTVLNARHGFRVMTVTGTATVVLDALTITGGNAGPDGYGGGVRNGGALTLTDVLVAGNDAGAGGGLDNAGGSLVVSGSVIEGNLSVNFGGGGIQNGGPRNLPGSVLLVSSTVSGNVAASDDGGGIFSGQNGHPGGAAPRPLCQGRRCRLPHSAPPGLSLTVLDSRITGNRGVEGGGIASFGPTEIAGSVIDRNSAGGADGGGVWAGGSIRDSTLSGNLAGTGGAVSSNPLLPLTITGSTLSGNHADQYGGAVNDSANVTIDASTLAANTAGPPGIGTGAAAEVQGSAALNMADSTVAGNLTTPAGGGAIDNFGGTVMLSFDTFAGNSGSLTGAFASRATGTILAAAAGTRNCAVPLREASGYNLATDASCGLSRPTDLTGADPGLGPLAANGGATSTEALPPGSPAINAGGLPATSGCPQTDQRGKTRPWGAACDIGAFELHYRVSPAVAGHARLPPRRAGIGHRSDGEGHRLKAARRRAGPVLSPG